MPRDIRHRDLIEKDLLIVRDALVYYQNNLIINSELYLKVEQILKEIEDEDKNIKWKRELEIIQQYRKNEIYSL